MYKSVKFAYLEKAITIIGVFYRKRQLKIGRMEISNAWKRKTNLTTPNKVCIWIAKRVFVCILVGLRDGKLSSRKRHKSWSHLNIENSEVLLSVKESFLKI